MRSAHLTICQTYGDIGHYADFLVVEPKRNTFFVSSGLCEVFVEKNYPNDSVLVFFDDFVPFRIPVLVIILKHCSVLSKVPTRSEQLTT